MYQSVLLSCQPPARHSMKYADDGEKVVTTFYDFTQSLPSPDQLKSLFASIRQPQASQIPQIKEQQNNLLQAWQDADGKARQQISGGQVPVALAQCVYFALVYTTINSMAQAATEWVKEAVASDVWSPGTALEVIERIPDQIRRTRAYVELLKTGSSLTPEQNEAIQRRLLTLLTEVDLSHPFLPDVSSEIAPLILEQFQAQFRALGDRYNLHNLVALAERSSGEEQFAYFQKAIRQALSLKHAY